MLAVVDKEQKANVFRPQREQHILQEAEAHAELAILSKQNSLRIDHDLLLPVCILCLSLLLLFVTQLQFCCLFLLIRSCLLHDFSLDLLVVLNPLNYWLECTFYVKNLKLLSERQPELQDLLKEEEEELLRLELDYLLLLFAAEADEFDDQVEVGDEEAAKVLC